MYDYNYFTTNTYNWIIIYRAVAEDIYTRTMGQEVSRNLMIALQVTMGAVTRDRDEKLKIFSILTGKEITSGYDLQFCEIWALLKLYASPEFRCSLTEMISCPLI